MKHACLMILPMLCVGCSNQTTVGEQYVGKPYINDPLGENIAPDSDPLIRFDAFDCTTFVETVLADGDAEKLNKIRYKNGRVGFTNRNHFIESEWIPNNSDLVKNISSKYAKTAVRRVKINRSKWMKRIHNITIPRDIKTIDLEYIPYENLGDIHTNRPLVVLFIRSKISTNKLGTDLAVRHMGFLLPNGVLRHASSSAGCVVDVNFNEYVAKMKKMPNNIGIVLLEIKRK